MPSPSSINPTPIRAAGLPQTPHQIAQNGQANRPGSSTPATVSNNGGVRAPQSPVNDNLRINQLFEAVREQERKGAASIAPARAISCTQLPSPTAEASQITIDPGNPLDCTLIYSHMQRKVAVVNTADSMRQGGGLGVPKFSHSTMPWEETLCVAAYGAKQSLDAAAQEYPIGQQHPGELQLYSSGLKLRHNNQQYADLYNVREGGPARIAAQREILLRHGCPLPQGDAPTIDMISIAAPDRRKMHSLDVTSLYQGMMRQLAHAMLAAKRNGADTFILALPGAGIFSGGDSGYVRTIAHAAIDAARQYGSGMEVVIPANGREMSMLLSDYQTQCQQGQGAQTGGAPVPHIKARSMGAARYTTVGDKLKPDSPVFRKFGKLLGDGSKASLHLTNLHSQYAGKQSFEILGRAPDGTGRALVSIDEGTGKHGVYELTFGPSLRTLWNAVMATNPL